MLAGVSAVLPSVNSAQPPAQVGSVCWHRLLTEDVGGAHILGQSLPKLSLSWANYHVPGGSGGAEEETVVCCAKEEGRAGHGGWGGVSLYYPNYLQDLYHHRGSDPAGEWQMGMGGRWWLLHRLVADHIDAIRFHDWLDEEDGGGGGNQKIQTTCTPVEALEGRGCEAGPVVVPMTMPEWTAVMLRQLASTHDASNDLWLSFLTSSQVCTHLHTCARAPTDTHLCTHVWILVQVC